MEVGLAVKSSDLKIKVIFMKFLEAFLKLLGYC